MPFVYAFFSWIATTAIVATVTGSDAVGMVTRVAAGVASFVAARHDEVFGVRSGSREAPTHDYRCCALDAFDRPRRAAAPSRRSDRCCAQRALGAGSIHGRTGGCGRPSELRADLVPGLWARA